MRYNFEGFGSYIYLEKMKRAINKCIWPYISVSLYNDNWNMCLACEGIVCREQRDE